MTPKHGTQEKTSGPWGSRRIHGKSVLHSQVLQDFHMQCHVCDCSIPTTRFTTPSHSHYPTIKYNLSQLLMTSLKIWDSSGLKENKLVIHEKSWRKHKCTSLSEKGQYKKSIFCTIIWHSRKGKKYGEKRTRIAKTWERAEKRSWRSTTYC